MNSEPHRTTHAPRPMHKNPWLGLLAGAATIVVVAGNIACEPMLIDEPKLLGSYVPLGIEWLDQEYNNITWADVLEQ